MTADMEQVADVIRAFEAGEIVVVTDDNDRENEERENCTNQFASHLQISAI